MLITALLFAGMLDTPMVRPSKQPNASLTLLHAYAGAWTVMRQGADKPDVLVNDCAGAGQYYVCQQSINGTVGGLLVFIGTGSASRFVTQNITPAGRPTGAGEMQITPDSGPVVWIFSSSWNDGAKKILYRTTNTFVSKDRIQFRQEESSDGGKSWKVTGAGEDIRSPAKH